MNRLAKAKPSQTKPQQTKPSDNSLQFWPIIFAVLLFLPLTAPDALAQNFIDAQQWYVDSVGGGVTTDGQFSITVEFDGIDGLTPGDHTHPYPQVIHDEMGATRNYRLSPTRRWLYVNGTPANSEPGTRVLVFMIPTVDGEDLIQIAPGETLTYGLAGSGFFDYQTPDTPAFLACIELAYNNGQKIFWINLENGATGHTTTLGTGVSILHEFSFAINGIASLVQYDGVSTGNSTFQLIGLCDDDLGSSLNPTGHPFFDLPGPAFQDAVLVGDPGLYMALMTANNEPPWSQGLEDCSFEIVGACCVGDDCLGEMSEADCLQQNGAWQGANSLCSQTECVSEPHLQITMTGPSQTTTMLPTTYSLSSSNTGTAMAQNSVARVFINPGVEFLSASDGGTTNGPYQVVWNLGNMDSGEVKVVNFTVRALCGNNSINMDSYTIIADGTDLITGSPAVLTTVDPLSSEPGTFSVSSSNPQGDPLLNGDTVTYSFSLGHAEDQPGANFHFTYGLAMILDEVIDDAGGQWTDYGSWFAWHGDLAAGASINLTVRLKLSDCRNEAFTYTRLNNGAPINVKNICGPNIGSMTVPLGMGVMPTGFEMSITANNLPQPLVLGTTDYGEIFLAEINQEVQFTWTLANVGTQTLDLSQAWLQLGDLVPVGNPPFIGTPPAGFYWDEGNNRIGWIGSLASSEAISVDLAAVYPEETACSITLEALAETDECNNFGVSYLRISAVPEAWTDNHLVMVGNYGTISRLHPGIDSDSEPWICLTGEGFYDLNPNNDGSFWIGGNPCIRLDPQTLDTVIIGNYFMPGMEMAKSAIEDPSSGLVYVAGWTYIDYVDYLVISSWDRATNQTELVYSEPVNSTPHMGIPSSMKMDAEGNLGITVINGLVVLDPDNPGTPEYLTDLAFDSGYQSLGTSRDGKFLVTENVSSVETEEAFAMINPISLDHNILLSDLNIGPDADSMSYNSVTEGAEGQYFMVTYYGRVTMVDLNEPDPQPVYITNTNVVYSGIYYHGDGTIVSAVPDNEVATVPGYAMKGIVPNPFNPRTQIRFELPASGNVRLDIYDLKGRLVVSLVNELLEAGLHEVTFNGQDKSGQNIASGIYFSRLSYAGEVLLGKMVLTR